MTRPIEPTRLLVYQQHQRLYMNNAWFRQAVDTLASMLPYWIDGIADEADRNAERMERAVESLMRKPLVNDPSMIALVASGDRYASDSKKDEGKWL
jgi:hypothetical protein